jgi:hypothetical protein
MDLSRPGRGRRRAHSWSEVCGGRRSSQVIREPLGGLVSQQHHEVVLLAGAGSPGSSAGIQVLPGVARIGRLPGRGAAREPSRHSRRAAPGFRLESPATAWAARSRGAPRGIGYPTKAVAPKGEPSWRGAAPAEPPVPGAPPRAGIGSPVCAAASAP